MKKIGSILIAAIALCGLLTLAACSKQSTAEVSETFAAATSEPTTEPTTEPTATPEPQCLNPLTGLPIDEAYLNRRPVAIMIEHRAVALPQLGIGSADIIYECAVEGQFTRCMAVYQDVSDVGEIGPIRSVRMYFLDIAGGLDSILCHCGGQKEALAEIPNRQVANMNLDSSNVVYDLDDLTSEIGSTTSFRDGNRKATMAWEHTLCSTGALLDGYISQTDDFRTEHEDGYTYPMTFQEGYTISGESASTVQVQVSAATTETFTYDSGSGKYLINSTLYDSAYGGTFDGAYEDGDTGEQLAVTNGIVIYTNYSQGNYYLDAVMTGTGSGLYFCGGQCVPITWHKDSNSTPFYYTDASGADQVFHPGNFFVCVISSDNTVSYS